MSRYSILVSGLICLATVTLHAQAQTTSNTGKLQLKLVEDLLHGIVGEKVDVKCILYNSSKEKIKNIKVTIEGPGRYRVYWTGLDVKAAQGRWGGEQHWTLGWTPKQPLRGSFVMRAEVDGHDSITVVPAKGNVVIDSQRRTLIDNIFQLSGPGSQQTKTCKWYDEDEKLHTLNLTASCSKRERIHPRWRATRIESHVYTIQLSLDGKNIGDIRDEKDWLEDSSIGRSKRIKRIRESGDAKKLTKLVSGIYIQCKLERGDPDTRAREGSLLITLVGNSRPHANLSRPARQTKAGPQKQNVEEPQVGSIAYLDYKNGIRDLVFGMGRSGIKHLVLKDAENSSTKVSIYRRTDGLSLFGQPLKWYRCSFFENRLYHVYMNTYERWFADKPEPMPRKFTEIYNNLVEVFGKPNKEIPVVDSQGKKINAERIWHGERVELSYYVELVQNRKGIDWEHIAYLTLKVTSLPIDHDRKLHTDGVRKKAVLGEKDGL